MSTRKETPDILGEILGGESAPEAPAATTPPPSPAAPKRRTKPRRAPAKPKPQKSTVWQYQVVTFQNYKGWRPRYINGEEQPDWSEAPLLHDYLTQMGSEGWELATASSGERMYGSSDKLQLYLKRPKP